MLLGPFRLQDGEQIGIAASRRKHRQNEWFACPFVRFRTVELAPLPLAAVIRVIDRGFSGRYFGLTDFALLAGRCRTRLSHDFQLRISQAATA